MKPEQIFQIEALMKEDLKCESLPLNKKFDLRTLGLILLLSIRQKITKTSLNDTRFSLICERLFWFDKSKAIFLDSPRISDLMFCAFKLKSTICFVSDDLDSPLKKLQKKFDLDWTQKIEVAQTGNSTLILLATRTQSQVVIHYGRTAEAKSSIERQKKGLICCHKVTQNSSQESKLPNIEDAYESNHDQWLVQSRIQGRSGQDIKCTKAFLHALKQTIDYSIDNEVLSSSTVPPERFVQNIIDNIREHLEAELRDQLLDAMSIVNEWLSIHKRGSCFMHGDLWLGNAVFDQQMKLSGVIDWEWASNGAPKIFDAIHCLLISYANFKKTNISRILPMIWSTQGKDSIIETIMNHISAKTQYTHNEQRVVSLIVWFQIIYRSHIKTGPRSQKWLHAHITELSKCLKQNKNVFQVSASIPPR